MGQAVRTIAVLRAVLAAARLLSLYVATFIILFGLETHVLLSIPLTPKIAMLEPRSHSSADLLESVNHGDHIISHLFLLSFETIHV